MNDIHHRLQEILSTYRLRGGRISALGYWHLGRYLAGCAEASGVKPRALLEQLPDHPPAPVAQRTPRKRLAEALALFQTFPDARMIRPELSFTHYRLLLALESEEARAYYHRRAGEEHWSSRQLRRQIQTREYERARHDAHNPAAFFKRHYVWELPPAICEKDDLPEHQLEGLLLDRLEVMLLEMGQGFAFVARQRRIVTASGKAFFVDLVFYNLRLRCYVLLELKIGELTHRDLGQMDAYLRLYDDFFKAENEQYTIGLLLGRQIDRSLLDYSLLRDNPRLLAATYSLRSYADARGTPVTDS